MRSVGASGAGGSAGHGERIGEHRVDFVPGGDLQKLVRPGYRDQS